MTPVAIATLRKALGLSQVEFGQLFGTHFMTVSKWERGIAQPSPYQLALLEQFARTAQAKEAEAQEEVKKLLIGAGVVAALIWLLTAAGKK
jgi:transcriptional regulator with XRE-family HTH domain